MRSGIHKTLRKAFKENKRLSIPEIYGLVSFQLKEPDSNDLRHTVRGAIHMLKKKNFITRTEPCVYTLTET